MLCYCGAGWSPWRSMISFIFARSGAPPAELSRDLAKIAGSEDAGRQDAETARCPFRIVAEGVDDPGLDEDRVSGLKCDVVTVDAPGRHAHQPDNRFIPVLVIVRDRHPRVRLHGHFKRVETAAGALLRLGETGEPDRRSQWSLTSPDLLVASANARRTDYQILGQGRARRAFSAR